MPYLTRREAIMSGENITPMTREEAILQNQAGLKVFTKEEQLRLNNYVLTPADEEDEGLNDTVPGGPVQPINL